MKYYVNNEKQILALNIDGSQDDFLPPGYTPISLKEKEDILTEQETNKLNKYLNSLDYRERRKIEYPSIFEYIDAVVKKDDVQLQNYINACLLIKEKYPKP